MTITNDIVMLKEGGGMATRKSELSVKFRFERGILLMVFDQKGSSGGCLHLLPEDKTIAERIKRLVQTVEAESPGAKILGQSTPGFATAVRKLVTDRNVPILAENVADTGTSSGVLQPALGKIRFKRETPAVSQNESAPVPGVTGATGTAAPPVAPEKKGKTRVLIVDDAPVIRQLLRKILSADSDIEIVGEAASAAEADEWLKKDTPDVITLDIHMPGEDGVSFLGRLMQKKAIPVVMITSVSMEEGEKVFEALSLGAVDYLQKPALSELAEMAPLLCEKVRVAARVKVELRSAATQAKSKAPRPARAKPSRSSFSDTSSGGGGSNYKVHMVAIGASTGGVQALTAILEELPENIPPIAIVQHIPPVFSRAFAERLDRTCPFRVKEAEDGDPILPNQVLLAPGGMQMKVETQGSRLVVRVFDGPRVNRHKPSVEVLFNSVAEVVGPKALGMILTGMGEDGAEGLLRMKQKGAFTIAQDEASCVVFGMPGASIRRGAALKICPLSDMAKELMKNST